MPHHKSYSDRFVANNDEDYSFGTPEKNLIAATLSRALADYISPKGYEAQRWRREAQAWIYSEYEHEFGFIWCCRHLDLEVDTMRGRIELFKTNGIEWAV